MTKTVQKFGSRLATLALTSVLLAACSLIKPPPVDLPSKSGITPGETITVVGNQSIYGIAKDNHVSMRELIVLNDIHAPFTLRAGQKLVLPADKLTGEESFSGAPVTTSSSVAPAPVSASSGAVETAELPPVAPAPVTSTPIVQPVKPVGTAVTSLNAPSQPPKPVATTVDQAGSQTVATESKETPTPSVTFTWPVQGPVLSGFGPKGQGLSNDGMNIGAPKGAPVVAAASGVVVYAGNEMKGFGTLVLIRHQGGWVTAYAHLDRALVSKDAVVAQGDMIGTVGKTGNVPSPQLHFETRYNGKPVDPAGVIKAQ